jgi:hypothetical protein
VALPCRSIGPVCVNSVFLGILTGIFDGVTLHFCDKCEGEITSGADHILKGLNTGSQLPVLLVLGSCQA